MIPRTHDGRVLFAVPWLDHVILGTTDEPRSAAELEPRPLEREIEFLLAHAAEYLAKPVARTDVLSVFTGLRPLVRKGSAGDTASLSRDHVISVSPSGLVTITGGKWTSYRKMAEDAVTRAAEISGLPSRKTKTETLQLHSAPSSLASGSPRRFACYGNEAASIERLIAEQPQLGQSLHPGLDTTVAEVVWAARYEMARTVDDVLSRRSRALQLDARAAIEAAPLVASVLARELGKDAGWIASQVAEFESMAAHYLPEKTAAIEGVHS